MQSKQTGALAIAVGIIFVLLAVLADTLGIGGEGDSFGWKQVALLIVGVLVAAAGVMAVMRGPGEQRRDTTEPPSDPTAP